MADPATCLASSSVLGPYFPLRADCLCSVCVIDSFILEILRFSGLISSTKLHRAEVIVNDVDGFSVVCQ